MKKCLALLVVMILLLSLLPLSAFADALIPPDETPEPSEDAAESSPMPLVLISVAVMVIAFILWRVLRKKA